jgi:TolB-like protein/tetratricopeptide (TPR) repeat protein
MSLFSELKRRNVLRVTAAYVAVSWLLIQVVETLFPVFGLSDAAIRAVVIVLAIGLVPAVVVAWAFELTPDGLVRDSDVDRGSVSAKASTRRLDRIVMVALALAVGYFAFDKFMLDPARDQAREQAIAETAREEGRTEAAQASRDAGPPVLAVLPFSAVTDTEDSVFFAAGVHDDLLTKLAQLPSMLVISRTSVLEYKDTQENIRDIGAALGADAILEGGVQSAGNRIRINAQLIDARTDEHLWAETYDRELTTASIFDVQDDIARAISEALHITLISPAEGSLIPTSSMAAYRAYHQALIIEETVPGGTTSPEYRELLQKAAELDPAFTRPLALLVGSYALDAFGTNNTDLIEKAETLLETLRAIAPDSPDFLIAQVYYTYYILRDYTLALQIADQTLEIVPSDTQLIAITAWIKRRQGNHAGYIESMRRAQKLEPGNDTWTRNIISQLIVMHEYDAASAEIEAFEGRDYTVERARATLAVREHGDLKRLATETERLAYEIGHRDDVWDVWQARFDARDFEGAAEALGTLPYPRQRDRTGIGLSGKQALSIETFWALKDAEKLAEHVAEARRSIGDPGVTNEPLASRMLLSLALLAAVEGNPEEAERRIRDWFRVIEADLTEKAVNWELACRALGMAGAAEAAVKCIRDGLEQPSSVTPFLEPYVPSYDHVRDEPVFVELAEDLDGR